MSKLVRIEQELSTLSPATSQKLGDAYLKRFRSWRIQSWGTMVGADKDRTGVPDSWCRLPDDRYVFLAYTTADKDLPAKPRKELEDCINRTQATIAAAQVERICLVFNPRCSPKTVLTYPPTRPRQLKASLNALNCQFVSGTVRPAASVAQPATPGQPAAPWFCRAEHRSPPASKCE